MISRCRWSPSTKGPGHERHRCATAAADLRDQGWGFAFSRRWLGYLAFAIVFAIACGGLSAWQLARSKEAAAANALISTPTSTRIRSPSSERAADADLVLPEAGVEAGHRDRDVRSAIDELLVRNRPFNGSPGFEVLTPLRIADGSLFIVDRGWVPTGSTHGRTRPRSRLHPREGHGRRAPEAERAGHPRPHGASATRWQRSSSRSSEQKIGSADVYTGAYGLLDSQKPAPATAPTPTVTDPPTQDEGLHWSYMIQWIIFALIGFFGLGYALRTEYRKRNEDDAGRAGARRGAGTSPGAEAHGRRRRGRTPRGGALSLETAQASEIRSR